MEKKLFIYIIFIGIITPALEAKDRERASFCGKVYSDFHYSNGADQIENGFFLTKAYVSWSYLFSPDLSLLVAIDADNPGNESKLERMVYIKNAFFKYRLDNWSFEFGLIGTRQFKIQEKSWANRYVYKSFQDAYNWGNSADMGIQVQYQITRQWSTDFAILNGEGYKTVQKDSHYKLAGGIEFSPHKKLLLRAYADITTNQSVLKECRNSIAVFGNLNHQKGSVGVEFNHLRNDSLLDIHKAWGISTYANWRINKFKGFGRYDCIAEQSYDGHNKDVHILMCGLEASVKKFIKITPNWRGAFSDEKTMETYWGINTEVAF